MDQTPVGDVVETGFYLAFSVHGYLALRRYYDYSPGHTLFRYALLLLRLLGRDDPNAAQYRIDHVYNVVSVRLAS